MRTEKITGYFDVRQYVRNVDRRDRKLIADGSNITFSVSFGISELPEMFKVNGQPDTFVKTYVSKGERDNAQAQGRQAVADRASVTFKIGANCRWFDKFGKACSKPTNAELDEGAYEVMIDFGRKDKNPNDDKAPCGYWANAIMFRKQAANPFEGHAFEQDEEAASEADAEQAPVQVQESANKDGELPF